MKSLLKCVLFPVWVWGPMEAPLSVFLGTSHDIEQIIQQPVPDTGKGTASRMRLVRFAGQALCSSDAEPRSVTLGPTNPHDSNNPDNPGS
jgi:hypothetical protein